MLKKYPQRVAWLTIIMGFFIFCLVCAGTGWLVRWVLFESTMELDTTLYISRDQMGVSSPDDVQVSLVDVTTPVETDATITAAGELAQGYLTIRDSLNHDIVLATVHL